MGIYGLRGAEAKLRDELECGDEVGDFLLADGAEATEKPRADCRLGAVFRYFKAVESL